MDISKISMITGLFQCFNSWACITNFGWSFAVYMCNEFTQQKCFVVSTLNNVRIYLFILGSRYSSERPRYETRCWRVVKWETYKGTEVHIK